MDCTKFTEFIIPYLDQEVDETTRIKFEQHLTDCASCTKLFENLKATYGVIEVERNLPANPFFYSKLLNKLEEPREAKVISLITAALKPIAVAASISLGILIGNGELDMTTTSDTELETLTEIIVPQTPSDYSVWITMNDNYGN